MPGNADLALVQSLPEPNQALPVILMTGYPSALTAIRAVNLAVFAYLVKPLEFPELLAQVRRAVAQGHFQAAAQDSARRLHDWAGEMARMGTGFGNLAGGVPVQPLLGAMLGRMGETLMDMKRLVDLGAGLESGPRVCAVRNCPRLEACQQVLEDGVAILEKTKGAFKSKSLEDLRRRMEEAIAGRPVPLVR
jgi:hypothetical protein